jgi:hypothetical protein
MPAPKKEKEKIQKPIDRRIESVDFTIIPFQREVRLRSGIPKGPYRFFFLIKLEKLT